METKEEMRERAFAQVAATVQKCWDFLETCGVEDKGTRLRAAVEMAANVEGWIKSYYINEIRAESREKEENEEDNGTATEKQIAFARKLGIAEAEKMTKKQLSREIELKLKKMG